MGFMLGLLAACSSTYHKLELTSGYSPPVAAKILVDEVKASSEQARQKLQQALNQALAEEGLIWKLKGRPLLLAVEIIEYAPDRTTWLPGVSAFALAVRATLRENDRIVGMAEVRRKAFGFGRRPLREQELVSALARQLVKGLKAKLYVF